MDFKDSVDKQCESIDFSNSCRQFYMTRMKATEDFKKQVTQTNSSDFKRRTTIDNAMETLRKEMASLMDQDLSLMKQLLTLNETIEEIKFKRMHASSNSSFDSSSCYLGNSEWSMDGSEQVTNCNLQTERLTVPSIKITADNSNLDSCTNFKSNSSNNNFVEKDMIIGGKTRHIIHGRGNFSLDSGYDEADDYQTDHELSV